jgi:hypothetical protein
MTAQPPAPRAPASRLPRAAGIFEESDAEQKAKQTPLSAETSGDLSTVPESGLPGVGKKLCENKGSKQAFVGLPRNACLARPIGKRQARGRGLFMACAKAAAGGSLSVRIA